MYFQAIFAIIDYNNANTTKGITMDTLDLEELTAKATDAVATALPEDLSVFVQDDGGGDYIVVNIDDDGTYLLFSAPTLFNGVDAPWQGHDGDHSVYFEQEELTINSDPKAVAEWIQGQVKDFQNS